MDGSLTLKGDAVLPNAPPGREKFGDRDMHRRVYDPKAKQRGHEELDPITTETLDERACENSEALGQDSFWADQLECALYYPGEGDTPINFAMVTCSGKWPSLIG